MAAESAPIFAAALGLPEPLRADLAAQLLASLDAANEWDADDALENELARRQQSLRDGSAKTYSAEETIAAMQAAIARPNS